MQEVTIRLRITQPCLGFVRRDLPNGRGVIYRMPRDCQDRVVFLTSWWLERMQYAARVAGKCYDAVGDIAWATNIDGRVSEWKRTVASDGKKQRYALHEAFRPRAEIGITAVLPHSITINDFIDLLTVVGTYKGISPFQSKDETYGTFEVLSVLPTIRQPVQEDQRKKVTTK